MQWKAPFPLCVSSFQRWSRNHSFCLQNREETQVWAKCVCSYSQIDPDRDMGRDEKRPIPWQKRRRLYPKSPGASPRMSEQSLILQTVVFDGSVIDCISASDATWFGWDPETRRVSIATFFFVMTGVRSDRLKGFGVCPSDLRTMKGGRRRDDRKCQETDPQQLYS